MRERAPRTLERSVSEPIGAIASSGAAPAPVVATSSRAMVAASEQATTAGAASATDAAAPLRAGDALVARIQQELSQARALGAEAERAAQALRAGETTDVAGVLLATRKADAAFQMLQAVRNAMLDAYAQMRDLRA